MKHFLLIIVISLFVLTSIKAQNSKNEITIGVHGGWFFDDTKFVGTLITDRILMPNNISYTRHINQKHAVMVDYSWNDLRYHSFTEIEPTSDKETLIYRDFHLLQASYIYKTIQTGKFTGSLMSGLSYRFGGIEGIGIRGIDNILFYDANFYKKALGANIGFQTSWLMTKKINLITDVRYIGLLSELSPNYLNVVFRVGFLF